MSKYASSSVSILVDGYDLSPALHESISRSTETITQQTNPFGTAGEGHSPTGMVKSTLNVGGGIYDQAVDPLHPGKIAAGGVGESRIVCITNEGQAKGKHFTGYEGAYSQKSEAVDTNGALAKSNVTYIVSGSVDEGVILQELASKTGDWTTETSDGIDAADEQSNRRIPIATSSVAAASVITTDDDHGLVTGDVVAIFDHTSVTPDINDNPAAAEAWKLIGHSITRTGATTFTIPVNVSDGGVDGYCVCVSRAKGGVGYSMVTQGSGFTNYVAKIRHSADNSSWADLITFADTTTNYHGHERKATATTTTRVERYLAYKGDVTGSVGATAFKVFGGFARGQ
jgi:hypothetical protein